MVVVDATRRNLSQGGVCYMLIQILQSIGQLLTSGARPVAGRLGPSVTSLKLAHTVPNGDACGGCEGRQPPAVRYGSSKT